MNIPTNARPSTRILKDLLKVRRELIKVENSNQPFVSKIDPLMKKDYFLASQQSQLYLVVEVNQDEFQERNYFYQKPLSIHQFNSIIIPIH